MIEIEEKGKEGSQDDREGRKGEEGNREEGRKERGKEKGKEITLKKSSNDSKYLLSFLQVGF